VELKVSGSSRHLTVGIVGGGIGGLAAAAFLQQEGIDTTVYEQASALSAVGAGLVVAPNAARLLRRLGALERFEERAVQLDVGWEFRRWQDGAVLSAEDLAGRCKGLYGEQTYTAHRADLLDAIKSAVDPATVRLGAKCTGAELGGNRPSLRFADGTTASHDVVVGADGVHSVLRGIVTEPTAPTYSGMCAFRALVPAHRAPDFARRRAQVLWLGEGRHLVHYPVSGGEFINLVAFAPAGDYAVESWTATATVEEFLSEFAGWDPRLEDLIRSAEQVGRWALLDRAPLDRWTRGRVTLLGDAAHAMFPFFAQGAAQAMEDAAALALTLSAHLEEHEAALTAYERMRLPRTTRLQEASRDRAEINHLADGPDQVARDMALARVDPLKANAWIYGYDLESAGAPPGLNGRHQRTGASSTRPQLLRPLPRPRGLRPMPTGDVTDDPS
jgi:salicylate hydroxylase